MSIVKRHKKLNQTWTYIKCNVTIYIYRERVNRPSVGMYLFRIYFTEMNVDENACKDNCIY